MRVLEPRFVAGLSDEAAGFRDAVRAPTGARPLREIVRATDRVAVVIPDITRPFPSDRVLPWLFDELAHVSAANFTIVNGTGSHRANTPAELSDMLGADILNRVRVVNHDAYDPATLAPAGTMPDGHPVFMNRAYVEADKRLLLGFIEPHLFAGFSGGYKAACPGLTDIATITRYHGAQVIADPRSTWGVIDGNPTQSLVREIGGLLPVDFLINVTMNSRRQITRFFCGAPLAAHEAGCRFARSVAMVPCPARYPLVITTNGGYPLDQNLYQAVKGMSAAAQIVEPGGLIVIAAQCNDGFPAHGNFKKLLFDHASPHAILDTVLAPGFEMFDQWEAQTLAMILVKTSVALYSDISAEETRRAHLNPIVNLNRFVAERIRAAGPAAEVAVMPEGPMTIPYLA